jgi:guanine deaminase
VNPSRALTITGPILNPRADGTVDLIKDGSLACDEAGIITFVGPAKDLPPPLASSRKSKSLGIICPPFLDAHIHIPQHPIRGHFMDGIVAHPEGGRLLAGLNRNVFPAEATCADTAVTERVVADFARDTLAQGVVGGAAYMTVHRNATHIALEQLGERWSVGLVLMEMNCPAYLRVDPDAVIEQMRELGQRFGKRSIVTDRFAVAVSSELRRRAARLASDLDLRTQTHLNEQLSEKWLVERQLYPDCASYTDVYYRDGLLDMQPLLAHCIHMTEPEFAILSRRRSFVAHCPTSNTLLCSGIMPLDKIVNHGLEYAICTDVGASPTTSMLAEMAQYLKVHAGRSIRATPAQALYRATLAPALMLGLDTGSFDIGAPMSFIEVEAFEAFDSADETIRQGLLGLTSDPALSRPLQEALDKLEAANLDVGSQLDLLEHDIRDTARRLEHRVMSVTLDGEEVFRRSDPPAL